MCNCGKNQTQPTGTVKRAQNNQAQAAADRAKAVAEARAANPSTTRIGAAAGVTQTFSLGDITFGSALERDAYLARHGR
jgi:hypothetical protein